MPALGDYLGTLLAEITNARLQADLESARIAQLYASHPLLRHMPVPRFRLPNVVLDLPVAVESIDPPSRGTRPPTAALQALQQRVDGIIEHELKQRKLTLSPIIRQRLTNDLKALFVRLKKSDGLSVSDVLKASSDAVAAAVTAISAGSKYHATADPTIDSSLPYLLGLEFLTLQPPPPRAQVLVVTTQLKDIAPLQTLTRIQLTISEEGMEWTQVNPSDPSSKTLLPE